MFTLILILDQISNESYFNLKIERLKLVLVYVFIFIWMYIYSFIIHITFSSSGDKKLIDRNTSLRTET